LVEVHSAATRDNPDAFRPYGERIMEYRVYAVAIPNTDDDFTRLATNVVEWAEITGTEAVDEKTAIDLVQQSQNKWGMRPE